MPWQPPTLGEDPYYDDLMATLSHLRTHATARVYQEGGLTIAVGPDGIELSRAATSAAQNRTAIQAGIDAVDGALVAGGHGGGGLVALSAHRYDLAAEVVLKYGVSIEGTGYGSDRGAGQYDPALGSAIGTTLRATTNSMTLLRCGTAGTGTTRVATNPHGVAISSIVFDGRGVTGATGVKVNDTADLDLLQLTCLSLAVGLDIGGGVTGSAGTVATKIGNVDFFGCTTAINVNPAAQTASDGEINNCRILQTTGTGIVMSAGGWQIGQNHFTTAAGGGPHIAITSSPALIENNYLDTVGNAPHVTCTSSQLHLIGNYIKASNGRNGTLVQLSNVGYRAVINANIVNPGTGTTAFVELPTSPSITGQDVVIMGNSINTTDPTGWIAPVILTGGTVVPDQDTASGPYVKGNRTWP